MLVRMPKHGLEAQLMELTREFVAKLVDAIRSASFAEVASLSGPMPAVRRSRAHTGAGPISTPVRRAGAGRGSAGRGGGARGALETEARRAELSARVMKALQESGQPLGVRALASMLGVVPDLLTGPIRELRVAGRVRKHGEKRSTRYSAQ